ncbi:carbohydrate-binding family 9-like protein [Bacteroidota bacterium]
MKKNEPVYKVFRLRQSMKIDGDWEKSQWQKIKDVVINNHMGDLPGFLPDVKAKMMYDDENLYVIFLVKDRYVRCITKNINGPVWEDACVEFFFSPDTGFPERYFNLEINCGGTPLMHYNVIPGKDITMLEINDIELVEVAHSLPLIIDPEITDPVTWTIEYRIPVVMLKKYSQITRPEPGISWKANFYKIAENSSNPHYLTWSVVDNPIPDFHLPQFFGQLNFQ